MHGALWSARLRLQRAAGAFVPSWIEGLPHARLLWTLAWFRLAVSGAALLLVLTLPATFTQRILFIGLLVFLYLPFAIAHLVVWIRPQGPLMRIAVPTVDVLIVFALQAVFPPTRLVAMFGYLFLVALYGYIGGRAAGALVGGAAIALSAVARAVHAGPPAIDLYTLLTFGVVVAGMVWLVDAAGREQRVSSGRLAQLHESLRSVTSPLGLHEILDAVAASARSSLGAAFSTVLMSDNDELVTGAVQGIEPQAWSERWSKEAVAAPHAGPSAVALRTGRAVVVHDFETDRRFSRWAEVGRRLGFSAMIAAPLLAEERAVGILNVYLAGARRITPDMVELAEAYAQQAAAAVVRATSYERERAAGERLREVDRLKDEFLATVSHELRTPLTSIKGFAYTAISRWRQLGDDLRLETLERIAANSDRLEALVEQLLDLSRLDAPEPEIHPDRLPIAAAVRECVATLEPAIGKRRVVIDVPPSIEAQVDPHGFERILLNLLTNAAKFSGPSAPIHVEGRLRHGEVVITVRDHGPGIPPDKLKRIFDPFYRGSALKDSPPGTGVGLAIVRRYVELHGGRVWAESVPAEGATVSFTVPPARMSWRPPKPSSSIAS